MSRPAVLVVEDEPRICELIAEILRPEGFEPVCANSDNEALDLLRARQPFACLVVDVNLREGLTGFDVARFARSLTPNLPVVFTSGEASRASFDIHAVDGSLFLAKPFTAEDMIAKVQMLVRPSN
jgi:CheY-like chemotaxis protein